ncbi:MAG: helicase [Verrucomicrobia bacterium]|jgi:superfamily II DNA/RNA helicase|nr:helicase [Verrucomicrobiota bacterium]
MSTKFFTNRDSNTLLRKFEGVFEHNKDIEFFDALVGYFRASGYFAIRPYIEDVPNIRVLVGINVDKVSADFHKKGLLFLADANRTINEFRKETIKDIQTANYDKATEKGIARFVDDIIAKKIEIKAHPSKQLHAKIYILRPEGFCEHKAGSVITGSSNLTEAGLGKKETGNYEFNVQLYDYGDVKFASDEFDLLWDEGVPILPIEAEKIKKDTYLNNEVTPFELYIKFLIEYFGTSIEFDPTSATDLPKGWKSLAYQSDAVSQGFDLLQKHNGFFLADVVGLGKTVIATLIAKKLYHHLYLTRQPLETLVITPPSLKGNWEDTLDEFGLTHFKIVTNGSLHKVKKPERYDLVIIDEAHKFRTDTAESYTLLQNICKTDVLRRNEKSDRVRVRKKVILVSATPLNNQPEDIRNLVYLFQDAKDTTLEISNLQHFFSQRIKEFKAAKKEKDIPTMLRQIKAIYQLIRTKVVQPLTIRRTRTDLMEHDQYRGDLLDQGIIFPKVEKPKPIYYPLDATLEDLYDRTIFLLQDPIKGLTYNRYRAIGFLKPDKKAKYQNADLISAQLAKIMKTMLVKRIDSSFHAFKKSLGRFRDATEAMIRMFERNEIIIAPNLPVSEYIMEGREDELMSLALASQANDPTIEICTEGDFEPDLIKGLKHDLKILTELAEEWTEVKQDPKLNEFLKALPGLLDPKLNEERKIIIFSESKETTHYVRKALEDNGYDGILTIDSKNRKNLLPVAKENFDANHPLAEQKNDFQILISTEVLAEGVNLHRSNTVLNYDTPWNSTRLMQRIGRVNRIGTKAERIHIYNFYPTAKVNTDIELEKKAILKLQAFHSALGEDSQIYSTDEEIETFGLFDREIEEERDERLAYLMELRGFKDENPELFRKIKNLPLRCRTGRKDKLSDTSSLTFIRNERRDAFYFIKPDNSLEELTFVETARRFKTVVSEKSLPLHEKHHEQIQAAVEDFRTKLNEEASAERIVDAQQGPNERKAKQFLDMFLNMSITGAEEKRLIEAAKLAIRRGRFTALQRDINKLQRNIKKAPLKPGALLDKLIEILEKFPLDPNDEEDTPLLNIKADLPLQPEIIISESFTAHS